MATHTRLRANGFGIVSVIIARTPLDARVWLGQWCKAHDRLLIVAPTVDHTAALRAYKAKINAPATLGILDALRLPVLLIPGTFAEALPVAASLAAERENLPVAVACGLSEVVESLLDPAVSLRLVSTALQGLIPTEEEEQKVLKTVAEGRKVTAFLHGACEGLVYYMLEARPETRGLFAANARIESTFASRRYEVDLLCTHAKLVIEIDGPEHDQHRRRSMDAKKQADLEGQGYCVRRFSNEQVVENPAGVWRLIHEQLTGRINAKGE